jgi:hypothetical protein
MSFGAPCLRSTSSQRLRRTVPGLVTPANSSDAFEFLVEQRGDALGFDICAQLAVGRC